MSTEWFYRIDEQEHGPVAGKTLKLLAEVGQITPNTLVRKSTSKSWNEAHHVKQLFDAHNSQPKIDAPPIIGQSADSQHAKTSPGQPPPQIRAVAESPTIIPTAELATESDVFAPQINIVTASHFEGSAKNDSPNSNNAAAGENAKNKNRRPLRKTRSPLLLLCIVIVVILIPVGIILYRNIQFDKIHQQAFDKYERAANTYNQRLVLANNELDIFTALADGNPSISPEEWEVHIQKHKLLGIEAYIQAEKAFDVYSSTYLAFGREPPSNEKFPYPASPPLSKDFPRSYPNWSELFGRSVWTPEVRTEIASLNGVTDIGNTENNPNHSLLINNVFSEQAQWIDPTNDQFQLTRDARLSIAHVWLDTQQTEQPVLNIVIKIENRNRSTELSLQRQFVNQIATNRPNEFNPYVPLIRLATGGGQLLDSEAKLVNRTIPVSSEISETYQIVLTVEQSAELDQLRVAVPKAWFNKSGYWGFEIPQVMIATSKPTESPVQIASEPNPNGNLVDTQSSVVGGEENVADGKGVLPPSPFRNETTKAKPKNGDQPTTIQDLQSQIDLEKKRVPEPRGDEPQ